MLSAGAGDRFNKRPFTYRKVMLLVEYRLLQNGKDTGKRFSSLAAAKEAAAGLLGFDWKITWVEDSDRTIGRWFGSAPNRQPGPAISFQIQRAESELADNTPRA